MKDARAEVRYFNENTCNPRGGFPISRGNFPMCCHNTTISFSVSRKWGSSRAVIATNKCSNE